MTNFRDGFVPSLCLAYFVAVFGHSHLCSGGPGCRHGGRTSPSMAVTTIAWTISSWDVSGSIKTPVKAQDTSLLVHGSGEQAHPSIQQFFFNLQNWYPGRGDGCGGGRVWNDKLSIGFPYVLLCSGKNPRCYGNTLRTIKQARRTHFLLWALCCHPQSLVLMRCLEPVRPPSTRLWALRLDSTAQAWLFSGWNKSGISQTYQVVLVGFLVPCRGLRKGCVSVKCCTLPL